MLTKSCPNCKQIYTPDLAKTDPDFFKKLDRWQGGEMIQRVWPEARAIQREQLQTGICSDQCWAEFLGIGDD